MRRKKKCGYCTKEKENESLSDVFVLEIEGSQLKASYDAYSCDSSFGETIEINFCPICGRNLKEGVAK